MDKGRRFTTLLHHVYNIETLREAYFNLKREAAPGVDGETWQSYGEQLESNLVDLSDRLRRGAYRAKPVRRVFIPKPDGRPRPLGVTTLEAQVETVATGAAPARLVYRVFEVAYEPSYRKGSVLYETANFLEAADYACELAGRRTWDALEIEKADGGRTETVWTYSESRAAAEEASREGLVHTFGYDPTRWDTRGQLDRN